MATTDPKTRVLPPVTCTVCGGPQFGHYSTPAGVVSYCVKHDPSHGGRHQAIP